MILVTQFIAGVKWIWSTPWYIRLYFFIIILPNVLINSAVYFFLFLPWHNNDVEARIATHRERRDAQISQLIERQTQVNQNMNDNILRMERHQSIFMQELIRSRQIPQNAQR